MEAVCFALCRHYEKTKPSQYVYGSNCVFLCHEECNIFFPLFYYFSPDLDCLFSSTVLWLFVLVFPRSLGAPLSYSFEFTQGFYNYSIFYNFIFPGTHKYSVYYEWQCIRALEFIHTVEMKLCCGQLVLM